MQPTTMVTTVKHSVSQVMIQMDITTVHPMEQRCAFLDIQTHTSTALQVKTSVSNVAGILHRGVYDTNTSVHHL